MKTLTLIRIEWIKTTRRRAFWVALAFLTIVSGLIVVGELVQGRQGSGPPFVAPFAWAMAAAEMDAMPAFFLALTIAMLVTSEFSWRTARQNVIDGLSKEQFFAAKTLMLGMVLVTFMLVPFGVATGAALYARAFGATPGNTAAAEAAPASELLVTDEGTAVADAPPAVAQDTTAVAGAVPQDTSRAAAAARADSVQEALREQMRRIREGRPQAVYPRPDPDAPFVTLPDLAVLGAFAIGSLGFASMAFMFAMVFRSTGGAIGVFFMYFAFLEQIILLLVGRLGSRQLAQSIAPYLPVGALRAPMDPRLWHPEYVERLNTIRASVGQQPFDMDSDPLRIIGVPLLWIGVFLGLAFLDFRRRDL